jgi:hypothetical protein
MPRLRRKMGLSGGLQVSMENQKRKTGEDVEIDAYSQNTKVINLGFVLGILTRC